MNFFSSFFKRKPNGSVSPDPTEKIRAQAQENVRAHIEEVAAKRWPDRLVIEKSGFSDLYDRIILDLTIHPFSNPEGGWKDEQSFSIYSEKYSNPNLPYKIQVWLFDEDAPTACISHAEDILTDEEQKSLYEFIEKQKATFKEEIRRKQKEEQASKLKEFFPDLNV